MKLKMSPEVKELINILNINGYEGYIVGGPVRDSLMGITPKDWDITTNAKPEEIIDIFKNYKVLTTGIKHGTISIVINKALYEITTYRIDGEYRDNRRPDRVEFTNDLVVDLSRRDFTVNSMAYNDSNGLIDPFGGNKDLKDKIIRCVGDPDKRFSEDALRMLRGIRFSTQLEFDIEMNTMDSIGRNSKLIENISKERIREEFNKILLSTKPSKGIRMLVSTGLIDYIIPQIKETIGFEQHHPMHDKDVFEHILSVLDNTKADLTLRLAALLHDIAKPQCFFMDENNIGHFYDHQNIGSEVSKKILRDLKYDNGTIENVSKLVKEHMTKFDCTTLKSVKRLANRVNKDNMEKLIDLIYADIKGGKPPHDFICIEHIEELWDRIINEEHPLTVKNLVINGNDLIGLGIKEGKTIGIILNSLLEMVLENPGLNKKEILLHEAMKINMSQNY